MLKSLDRAYNRKKSLEHLVRKREKGVARSAMAPSDQGKEEYGHLTEIEVKIAWTGKISKNVILGRGNFTGRSFMKQGARDARTEISWLIKEQMMKRGVRFVDGKIWLDLFIQKPNAGAGDAINTLDLIADAVVDAIGVDDKWFSVRGIDWEIKKTDPMIRIRVGQEAMEPQKICTYCGISQPTSLFNKNKNGYAPMCNDCRKR